MRMYDMILKKRNGSELSFEEINYIVKNYTEGSIPDYQMASLLMAIYFQKMSKRETLDLTMAMAHSGDILDLSEVEGIKVDKHSTGGVGDKTTLVLGPMVAALGIPVVKMSGRGLGHTGGTIDKLQSFQNFNIEITKEELIKKANDIHLVVCSQSGNLAPADKKLYSLRDVTATVDNISLIASSVMSKKIAAGSDAIVLDVKLGDGAFMKTEEEAIALAKEMVNIGKGAGRKTVAVVSDMDQPLGFAVGNILEVVEAIDTLKGNGPYDLLELCLTLGENMVVLAGKASDRREARNKLLDTIKNKTALDKFAEFIKSQGGNVAPIYETEKFAKAKYIVPVQALKEGFVKRVYTERIGHIAMELGAGRATKESTIDLSVGLVLCKKRGDWVNKDEIIGYIHSNNEAYVAKASEKLLSCYEISSIAPEKVPLIFSILE